MIWVIFYILSRLTKLSLQVFLLELILVFMYEVNYNIQLLCMILYDTKLNCKISRLCFLLIDEYPSSRPHYDSSLTPSILTEEAVVIYHFFNLSVHCCYIVIILFCQGYRLFTREGFRKDDILMECKSDLISAETADLRREEYCMKELGSFIYDVEHKGKVV